MSSALSANITPDMFAHLKKRGQEPNIKLLKNAVDRLSLALTQKDGGRGKSTDKAVNFDSPELEMIQFTILCEAVALVLSGKLDELDDET
jgi:hypothetical protein